tara:strand:- start:165 stop:557 length:393 start_codon:yes stop_codon:yes gene_type:complete
LYKESKYYFKHINQKSDTSSALSSDECETTGKDVNFRYSIGYTHAVTFEQLKQCRSGEFFYSYWFPTNETMRIIEDWRERERRVGEGKRSRIQYPVSGKIQVRESKAGPTSNAAVVRLGCFHVSSESDFW